MVLPTVSEYNCTCCTIEQFSVDRELALYEAAGFLYPEKRMRIGHFLPKILDNWSRIRATKGNLHHLVLYFGPNRSPLAALTLWKTTNNGWTAQHLVSVGGPIASRAVTLTCGTMLLRGKVASYQTWFQPTNRFTNKLSASVKDNLGGERSALNHYSYCELPIHALSTISRNNFGDLRIVKVDNSNIKEFAAFAESLRGRGYVRGEEFDCEDFELNELDSQFKEASLRRFRRAFLAFGINSQGEEGLLGAVINYRGPFGLNLSLLENRCDILLIPGLAPEKKLGTIAALLLASRNIYYDFEPQLFLIVTEISNELVIKALGGKPIRRYSQIIVNQEGIKAYLGLISDHFNKIHCQAEITKV